ncbi:hypothetical protein [Agarilytica rhodophyticola]|uniref:hypothetical protein n=1 Tax=Agarilytica rhodophyticola TaxID=1737490 RepID=UPI000B344274|nr:hypothetical protein [Agarilytica rhodophyticola]
MLITLFLLFSLSICIFYLIKKYNNRHFVKNILFLNEELKNQKYLELSGDNILSQCKINKFDISANISSVPLSFVSDENVKYFESFLCLKLDIASYPKICFVSILNFKKDVEFLPLHITKSMKGKNKLMSIGNTPKKYHIYGSEKISKELFFKDNVKLVLEHYPVEFQARGDSFLFARFYGDFEEMMNLEGFISLRKEIESLFLIEV